MHRTEQASTKQESTEHASTEQASTEQESTKHASTKPEIREVQHQRHHRPNPNTRQKKDSRSISPWARGQINKDRADQEVEEADPEVEEADLQVEEVDRPETKKTPNTSESRHQAELLLGDGSPKPGTEKTSGGAHRCDSQPIVSGLSRGGWNNSEQGEEGRGGAPSPYIGARDFAGPHLRTRGEVSPSRASPRQPPHQRTGGGEIAPRAPRAATL
jgi:hypothetical protein